MPYPLKTSDEKHVADYLGIGMFEVQELPYDLYLFFRREACVFVNSQSESGREYLKNAWRTEQTVPDRGALREKLRKGGPANGR